MKITTDRGTLFTTASGKSILRWKGGKPPTEEGFNQLQIFIDNTVVRHMDPYVTMRTGMLKKSVILGSRMGSGELSSTTATESSRESAVRGGSTVCGRRLRTPSSVKSKITQGG